MTTTTNSIFDAGFKLGKESAMKHEYKERSWEHAGSIASAIYSNDEMTDFSEGFTKGFEIGTFFVTGSDVFRHLNGSRTRDAISALLNNVLEDDELAAFGDGFSEAAVEHAERQNRARKTKRTEHSNDH